MDRRRARERHARAASACVRAAPHPSSNQLNLAASPRRHAYGSVDSLVAADPLLAHLTDAGTSPSGIPLRIRSERAVAVGLAPFLNQCRARSAFTTRLSGSARGS